MIPFGSEFGSFNQPKSNFDKQFDKTFSLFNFVFKGFFIFWILSALAGIGLTVGLIVLIVKLIQHLN